jgi:hypothetical protein
MLLDEGLEAAGSVAVDLAFHRDPAVASAPAGIGCSLGDVEHDRRRRRVSRRWPLRASGERRRGEQEQCGDGEGAEWHEHGLKEWK